MVCLCAVTDYVYCNACFASLRLFGASPSTRMPRFSEGVVPTQEWFNDEGLPCLFQGALKLLCSMVECACARATLPTSPKH